jgi:hypothetical protein
VAWSFFGVRRRADYEDVRKLNPVHVIVAGVIGAALFVLVGWCCWCAGWSAAAWPT